VGHVAWLWATIPEIVRDVVKGLLVLLFSYVFVRVVEVICRIRKNP